MIRIHDLCGYIVKRKGESMARGIKELVLNDRDRFVLFLLTNEQLVNC